MGDRISQERRRLGVRLRRDVTPADLAGMLGVNAATVYRWESGEKSPREDALERMAELFAVAVPYLRYGVGSAETAAAVEDVPPGDFPDVETSTSKRRKRRA